jgi:2Fe-2S ferredoxin
MPKITYIAHDGTSRTVEAEVGATVMETAIRNKVPGIVAECGGACSCATCHVHVEEAWKERSARPGHGGGHARFRLRVRPTSRLSCQIKVTELDGPWFT